MSNPLYLTNIPAIRDWLQSEIGEYENSIADSCVSVQDSMLHGSFDVACKEIARAATLRAIQNKLVCMLAFIKEK